MLDNQTRFNNWTIKPLIMAAIIVMGSALLTAVKAQDDILPDLMPEEAESFDSSNDIDDILNEIDQALPEEVTPEPAPIDVAEPPVEKLEEPKAAPEPKPATAVSATDIPDIPSIKSEEEPEENLFFDAEALVPQGEMARKGAPRKVNPKTEPGSKLIVVKKEYDSKSTRAEVVAAQRAIANGRYESALEMFNGLYKKYPKDKHILMGRAEAYQRLAMDNEALMAYEKLLDVQPNNVDAKINMQGIIGNRYPDVALRQLLALRQKHSDHVGLVAQIAVMQAKLGQYQDAISYLGIAASLEPYNPSHVFNMAVVADKAGSKAEAIAFYEQALEIDTVNGKRGAIPRETIFARLASLR
jgi:Flp pilus assembly protein TadD